MDSLSAIGGTAAQWASASWGAAGALADQMGADPSPASATAASQAATQGEASTLVLRRVLDLEASEGAQLAQMVSQDGVDLYA